MNWQFMAQVDRGVHRYVIEAERLSRIEQKLQNNERGKYSNYYTLFNNNTN